MRHSAASGRTGCSAHLLFFLCCSCTCPFKQCMTVLGPCRDSVVRAAGYLAQAFQHRYVIVPEAACYIASAPAPALWGSACRRAPRYYDREHGLEAAVRSWGIQIARRYSGRVLGPRALGPCPTLERALDHRAGSQSRVCTMGAGTCLHHRLRLRFTVQASAQVLRQGQDSTSTSSQLSAPEG